MDITKEEYLKAINLIENYHKQEIDKIKYLKNEEYKKSISMLGLNARVINSLKYHEINTIGDLLEIDRRKLRKYNHIGKKAIVEINEKIKDFGIQTDLFKNY